MKKLHAKAASGLLFLFLVMSGAVFLSAGTVGYWQAWLCLGVFFLSSTALTCYLAVFDAALLERRIKAGAVAEARKGQKVIQALAQLFFIALLVVPALDHRFRWSAVPAPAALAGDALMLTGFAIVFLVFKVNTYTSATIEVARDQKVISTGPYAFVRHPMYSGALLLVAGIPIALGSWWGLLAVVPTAGAIVWRLLDEEVFLESNLTGYSEYRQKVRYRLIPLGW